MNHAGLLSERLRALSPETLRGLRRGIEKESLRTQPDGTLALTAHPAALGSPLTHPHITTDFSEALIELVTGVHPNVPACLEELERIHQFVYRRITDEVLWCASMPCSLPADTDIPIARYGSSNVARAKTVYRVGLAHRYGRRMQTIAGVHYNWSLPEAAWPLPGLRDPNEGYFALIRNFRRHSWMLLYLFGASPAVCSSFVEGRTHQLQQLARGTMYLPYATSLRMGRLGYLSEAQDSLLVSHNDLETYTASLYSALTTPYPAYEKIGIRAQAHAGGNAGTGNASDDAGDGYRQLATSLLQIENEFYSTIRPKRRIRPAERQLHALRQRGVEYVEVRALDLDPFDAVGIAAQTARFLDVFLLHCLLSASPPDTPQEIEAIGRNKQRVAARGREPGLRLERGSQSVELREWAGQVLCECEPAAAALDAATGSGAYREALALAVARIDEPASLPSARIVSEIQQSYDGSYVDFALAHSLAHRGTLIEKPLPPEIEARFARMVEESLKVQRSIEASDKIPFETYRERYLAHASLRA